MWEFWGRESVLMLLADGETERDDDQTPMDESIAWIHFFDLNLHLW